MDTLAPAAAAVAMRHGRPPAGRASFSPLARLLTVLAILSLAAPARAEVPAVLSPEGWPGLMPREQRMRLAGWWDEVAQGLKSKDHERVEAAVVQLVNGTGKYRGAPEIRPQYDLPLTRTPPDLEQVQSLWARSYLRRVGRHPWEVMAKEPARPEFRLRDSYRLVRAYLQSYEADLPRRELFLESASAGLRFLAARQARSGVFGYPYRTDNSPIAISARRIVEEARRRGQEVVENGWIVDDLETGALLYDNGETAATLLYGHSVTSSYGYVEAARRAVAWAGARPLVPNWNYNAFSALAMARLYLGTSESGHLDTAGETMRYGVWPGQMDNGWWFDQHNAVPHYAAIMLRAGTMLAVGQRKAGDPDAARTEQRVRLGLNALAELILAHGYSRRELWQVLELDALAMGLMNLGPDPRWEQAANVLVNFILYHADGERTLAPPSLAGWLLYRQRQAQGRPMPAPGTLLGN